MQIHHSGIDEISQGYSLALQATMDTEKAWTSNRFMVDQHTG